MATHYVATNVSNPAIRKFVRGILFLQGKGVILTGRKDIEAAKATTGFTTVAV